jgi:hypothetical protein
MKKLLALILTLTMLSAVPAAAAPSAQKVPSAAKTGCSLSQILRQGNCADLNVILNAACGSGRFGDLLQAILCPPPSCDKPADKPDLPPSQPDKPTDKPTEPDQPAEPDKPDEPDQPAEPDQPSKPDQPSEPDKPVTPPTGTLANGAPATAENVQAILYGLKADYPEGMRWTNANSYYCKALNTMGYGCAAYAFLCSDAVFGDLPVRARHSDFNQVRPGDILRINNDSHSVVVLEVQGQNVVVTEGNFNSSIHWGRTLSRQTLENGRFVVTSRYPG